MTTKAANDPRETAISEIENLGLLRDLRRTRIPKLDSWITVEGEIEVEGRDATLVLALPPTFPISLPCFYLKPWDALGIIPHVELDGRICYLDREGLMLDQRQPNQIVVEAYERVRGTLASGITRTNASDFSDEFENYWGKLADCIHLESIFEPSNHTCSLAIVTDHKLKTTFVAENQQAVASFYNRDNPTGQSTIERAVYVPLNEGSVIVPPRTNPPFWTVDDARNAIMPHVVPAEVKYLTKRLRTKNRDVKHVIFRLPRPSGGDCLFGIRYDGLGERHPLLEGGTAQMLTPLALSRLERSYIVPRGGGNATLDSKRVLLIGCGAVGGFLAFNLVRAGIMKITLMDFDTLKPENTFRHVLGRRFWGSFKVDALKRELEAEIPYVRVETRKYSITQALFDNVVDFSQYELVVLATGDPTVELEVNKRIHKTGCPALFTWLEPLGIGGHVLVVNNARDGGCLECLYTAPTETLQNRASFAAPNQQFGRALSGCGSLHTPYGAMDATTTATLAARIAIKVLNGSEKGNPLLSWKGEAHEFVENGFVVSDRYRMSQQKLDSLRYDYRICQCPVCGSDTQ